MKKALITLSISVSFLFLFGGYAVATPFTINNLTFEEVGSGVELTGAKALSDSEIQIWETVSDLDATISIDGLIDYGNPGNIGSHYSGFWLTKTVLNNTGQTWYFYDHELQSTLGTASANGDGLSFAQGTYSMLPWYSDGFDSFEVEENERDYINFFDGSVAHGESVTFTYAITHNGWAETIYLRQRPNFSTAPVPEPGTAILFGLGILGLAGLSRRK